MGDCTIDSAVSDLKPITALARNPYDVGHPSSLAGIRSCYTVDVSEDLKPISLRLIRDLRATPVGIHIKVPDAIIPSRGRSILEKEHPFRADGIDDCSLSVRSQAVSPRNSEYHHDRPYIAIRDQMNLRTSLRPAPDRYRDST